MKILISNVGSSSLKCQLYDMPDETVLAKVTVERIGSDEALVELSNGSRQTSKEVVSIPDYVSAIRFVLEKITNSQTGVLQSIKELDAVGFKAGLAKGITGCHFMDESVLAAMEEYSHVVAPLHNKLYVQSIRHFRNVLPNTPFVGLFETFFCQHLPDYEALYPIPWEWTRKYNIRKTMGHGATHFYVNQRIAELRGCESKDLNVIQFHLGGSSTIAGVKGGVIVSGTAGFTCQNSIPQSVRVSDMDPFLVPFLMTRGEGTLEEVIHRMMTDGGLAAVSGIGFDMRDLQEAAMNGHKRAQLAIDMYVCQARKYLGGLLVTLGHTDLITFAGGTGESSPYIRKRILENLEEFGILLDEEKNESCFRKECRISQDESKIEIWVVPTNEEIIVARECIKFLRKGEIL